MATKGSGNKGSGNYRDAGTGQFVPKGYADRNLNTTVREPRPAPKPSKGK